MDALKKAELAKSQARPDATGERTEPTGFPSLSLEPIAAAPPPVATPGAPAARTPPAPTSKTEAPTSSGAASSRLPELPTNLQGLDAQFIAHHAAQPAPRPVAQERAMAHERLAPEPSQATPASKPRQTAGPRAAPATKTAAASESDRAAARNLFETKESAAPAAKRKFAIGIGIVTLLSALGIGGYFWWQLQPKDSPFPFRTAPPVAALPSAQAPPPAVVAAAPQIPAATAGTAPTSAPATLAPSTSVTAPARPAVPPAPTFSASANTATDDDDEGAPPARKRVRAAPPAPALPAERLFQTTKKPLQVNPFLARGYEFFNRGDYAAARKEYERVLSTQPQNTDALHGMAAIAVRENHPEAAEHFYQRLLVADPKDSVALSGALNLRSTANPGGTESQLKALVAAQPDLAAAHVALGNLYSAQNRWTEAQQAYFNAYASEPENPDLLFNLAVSLEHLRKPALALQYYKQALAAARQRPAGFDPAQAQERLGALQP